MPVLVKAIADEYLHGARVYELDPQTPLIASQAAALLGRSKTRMDSDRRDGKPPKHYLDGRKVLYPLGEVLAERDRMQAITLEEAKAETRTTMVYIRINPDPRVPNYEGWWDVPIAEVI